MRRYLLVFMVILTIWPVISLGQGVNFLITIDSAFYHEARHLISQQGGRVDFYIVPHTIIAYLPPGTKNLIGQAGISEVLSAQEVLSYITTEEPVVICQDLFKPFESEKKGISGSYEMHKDFFLPEDIDCNKKFSPLEISRSLYLIGEQAWTVLTVEGSGDPMYNWQPGEKETVKSQLLKGLEWVQKFARESYSIAITWIVQFLPDVTIILEPAHCDYQDCDWLDQAVAEAGKGSIKNIQEEMIRAYAAQGACVAFLFSDADDDPGYDTLPPAKVVSLNKQAQSHSNYTQCWAAEMCRDVKESRFGFGEEKRFYYGGGYCALSKSASAWGIQHLWQIAAHEIYHCYGAQDEYDLSDCTTDELAGYLHGQNLNCRGQQQCIMRHAVYEYNYMCPHTAKMIGWEGAGPLINQLPRCVFQPTYRYMPFGNLNLGDYVLAYTLDGDWVNDGIRITRLNSFSDGNNPGKYCLKHDGSNFYANPMSVGIYYYLINGVGSPLTTAVTEISSELNILWNDFSIVDNHIFKIGSGNTMAFSRLEIAGGPQNIKTRPIWDEVSETGEIDFGFVPDGDYNATLFGWMPSGSTSPIYNHSFTINRGAPRAPLVTTTYVERKSSENLLILNLADSNYYIDGIKIEKQNDTNWDSSCTIPGAGQAKVPESIGSKIDTLRAISFNANGASVPTITTVKNAPNPPISLSAAVYKRPKNPGLGKGIPGGSLGKEVPVDPPPELVESNQIDISWQPPVNQLDSIVFYRIKYSWYEYCYNPPWCDVYPTHYTPPICSLHYSLYPLPYNKQIDFRVYAFDQSGDSSAFISGYLTTGAHDAHPGEPDMCDKWIPTPREFSLSKNYPNPFNPTTTINYALPMDAFVRLIVYNILGQKVKILVNEHQTTGYKQVIWDGKNDQGQKVSTGVYFCIISTDKFYKSVKMNLVK